MINKYTLLEEQHSVIMSIARALADSRQRLENEYKYIYTNSEDLLEFIQHEIDVYLKEQEPHSSEVKEATAHCQYYTLIPVKELEELKATIRSLENADR